MVKSVVFTEGVEGFRARTKILSLLFALIVVTLWRLHMNLLWRVNILEWI